MYSHQCYAVLYSVPIGSAEAYFEIPGEGIFDATFFCLLGYTFLESTLPFLDAIADDEFDFPEE